AVAFAWSAGRSFVLGSQGSRALAAAASTAARSAAARRLRHIAAGPRDELLRDRLLERDQVVAERRRRDEVERVLEPALADEDEVADEGDLAAPGTQNHRGAEGCADRADLRERQLADVDRDDLPFAGLLQLVGKAVLQLRLNHPGEVGRHGLRADEHLVVLVQLHELAPLA